LGKLRKSLRTWQYPVPRVLRRSRTRCRITSVGGAAFTAEDLPAVDIDRLGQHVRSSRFLTDTSACIGTTVAPAGRVDNPAFAKTIHSQSEKNRLSSAVARRGNCRRGAVPCGSIVLIRTGWPVKPRVTKANSSVAGEGSVVAQNMLSACALDEHRRSMKCPAANGK
jgi:hypothetical protein